MVLGLFDIWQLSDAAAVCNFKQFDSAMFRIGHILLEEGFEHRENLVICLYHGFLPIFVYGAWGFLCITCELFHEK